MVENVVYIVCIVAIIIAVVYSFFSKPKEKGYYDEDGHWNRYDDNFDFESNNDSDSSDSDD